MVLNGQNDLRRRPGPRVPLLAACGAVIRADRRIGGTVSDSHISSHSLRQVQTPDGTVATVTFSVACDTYTGT